MHSTVRVVILLACWCARLSSGLDVAQPVVQEKTTGDTGNTTMCEIPLGDRKAFTYMGRPWADYVGRWNAIHSELHTWFTGRHRGAKSTFSVIDLGSNAGFFSIQTAGTFPQAVVIGVEGSIGIGNGGAADGSASPQSNSCSGLGNSSGVQNHLKWIEKLGLPNSMIAGEKWDFNRVQTLAKTGFTVDVMYLLSMFHWMDLYIRDQGQYSHSGTKSVKDTADDTVNLMAQILSLASLHVIELPSFKDEPQHLPHLWKTFNGSEKHFLEAAMQRSGRSKTIKEIYVTRSQDAASCGCWLEKTMRRVFVIKDNDELKTHDRSKILAHMKSSCVLPTPAKDSKMTQMDVVCR